MFVKLAKGQCKQCLKIVEPELDVYDEDKHQLRIRCPNCDTETLFAAYVGQQEEARRFAWKRLFRKVPK